MKENSHLVNFMAEWEFELGQTRQAKNQDLCSILYPLHYTGCPDIGVREQTNSPLAQQSPQTSGRERKEKLAKMNQFPFPVIRKGKIISNNIRRIILPLYEVIPCHISKSWHAFINFYAIPSTYIRNGGLETLGANLLPLLELPHIKLHALEEVPVWSACRRSACRRRASLFTHHCKIITVNHNRPTSS